MKFITPIFQSIILIVIVGILSYWLLGFNSAFEADQMCHSTIANFNSNNRKLRVRSRYRNSSMDTI